MGLKENPFSPQGFISLNAYCTDVILHTFCIFLSQKCEWQNSLIFVDICGSISVKMFIQREQ
jgi:hypothetical protein